ncbi:PREDICTED: uncharacterized protein LOC109233694 [Nicotiana attenuata]|uniref:uncharacterized protein LOC109233694 n=1 Tax=Nicotiana attenuata TaxID=49451 RepID=UPI000905B723|nr:PREDICTED: uncharacterized protein LOC109233694 [Nicotiana attenuata]
MNKQLKANREKKYQKSDESFKSATEGEEIVSSETEQVSSGPKVTPETISEVSRNLENSLTKEIGAMVVWKEESAGTEESETLTNLLRNVTESYNPKKKGSSKVKTPGTARENKKRKAAPSVTVEIPPTRGRDTRSQLKQNEAELQKALEESKRKAIAKGKKKMDEPVDLDEMDLVLRDEDETEEVEVLTPKPKKAKTSTKKSVSKSKSAEPSTLEEEWSGKQEDDSDAEKDKMTKFGKRTILKGRLLRDLEKQGMVLLLEKLEL